MKKPILLLTALLMGANTSLEASQTPKKVKSLPRKTKIYYAFKATKDHCSNQNKKYFAKASVITLSIACFFTMLALYTKKIYKKTKRKSVGEKVAANIKKTFFKQPRWTDCLKGMCLFFLCGFITFWAAWNSKEQRNEVYQIYKNHLSDLDIEYEVDNKKDDDDETVNV